MGVCLLHAGTHKTGTTALQRLLGANDAAFTAAGICVPNAGRPLQTADAFGSHHNIAWELTDDPRFDPHSGTFADAVAEIGSAGRRLAVLSSEDFEYLHSKPAALHRMRQELETAGFTLKIVLYLRHQQDYARSLYRELFNHGWNQPVDQYVGAILRDGMVVHRNSWIFDFVYSRLLDSFVRVIGAENVIARSYVSQGDGTALPADFLKVLHREGAAAGSDEFAFPGRLNQSNEVPAVSNDAFAPLRNRFSSDNAFVRASYGVDLSR